MIKLQITWREKVLHEKAKRELAELDLKLKHDQLVEVDQVGELPR